MKVRILTAAIGICVLLPILFFSHTVVLPIAVAVFTAMGVWEMLGCPDQNNMIIHLDGHAILPSDMQYILDYCDVHLYGKDPSEVKSDLSQMKGNLFLEHNRDVLGEEFAPYLEEIQN